MFRNILYKTIQITTLIIAAGVMFSCSKDDDFHIKGTDSFSDQKDLGSRGTSPETRKVLILYSAGYNSLSSYLAEDIEDLETGYLPGDARYDDVILIFSKKTVSYGNYTTQTSPYLIRLYKDESGKAVMDTVLTMDSGTIASSTVTMKKVLTYIKENFPARSYGMIFSSHATGWLPPGYYSNSSYYESESYSPYATFSTIKESGEIPVPYIMPQTDPLAPAVKSRSIETKSIGQDLLYKNGGYLTYEINLKDIAAAIPMHFDYILFDACLMGGIETAYELKDVCSEIGFSQTEVLAEGFDYSNITSYLLKEETPDPESVCRDYFEYYNAKSDQYRSATVSLVNCSGLDSLADVCKRIFEDNRAAIAALDPSEVQGYFRFDKHWFYDLKDIASKAGASQKELDDLQNALDYCILYKNATPSFIDSFDITSYSGLSMYLPCNGSSVLDNYYKLLAWNKTVNLVE
ncbi:MAG: clostripain-related cysteine peptidase [Bacteroidales bacterium]|nr:clostripain-related cysteine peptidase [Bacteroidales bacterium]MCI1785869.1 clostripain-related cysteine peptidase [Bacteroidales bacterium]